MKNVVYNLSKSILSCSFQTLHFRDFLLKPEILRAIGDCGFEHPSEVQHECIPQVGVVTINFSAGYPANTFAGHSVWLDIRYPAGYQAK